MSLIMTIAVMTVPDSVWSVRLNVFDNDSCCDDNCKPWSMRLNVSDNDNCCDDNCRSEPRLHHPSAHNGDPASESLLLPCQVPASESLAVPGTY